MPRWWMGSRTCALLAVLTARPLRAEVDAGRLPVQAAEGQDARGLRLRVARQALVVDVEHEARRRLLPVRHQRALAQEEVRQLGLVVAVGGGVRRTVP